MSFYSTLLLIVHDALMQADISLGTATVYVEHLAATLIWRR